MKKIYAFLLIALTTTLSGCYMTGFDTPPTVEPEIDPDPTTLSLDIVALGLNDDDSTPEDFIGIYADYSYPLTSENYFTWTEEVASGTYTIYVYTTLEDQITIENRLASAEQIVASSSYQYGVADNDYKNLYFGSKDIEIVAQSDNFAEVEVSKTIKDILFIFTIEGDGADRVESISATLSGVAQSWELISNAPYGESSTIDLPFDENPTSMNFSYIRVLGIDPSEAQEVVVSVDYIDGDPISQIETFDISTLLSDFNLDKSATAEPIELTITTAALSDYTMGEGSIDNWGESVDGNNYQVDAE